MEKVFISYAHINRRFAQKLAKFLQEAHIPVWWDEWEIHPGDNIVKKINQGIKGSAFFLVILTPESTTREWVTNEWTTALTRACNDKKLRIIPILKADCDIPPILEPLKYIDFRNRFAKPAEHLKDFLWKEMGISELPRESLEDEWITKYEKGSPDVQADAVEILTDIGTARAMDTLLADIELRSPRVQSKIMRKLLDHLSADIAPHLRRLSKSGVSFLAIQACGYLLALDDNSVLPVVIRLAKSNDSEKRRMALRNLALFKNYSFENLKRVVDVLVDSLRHHESCIRLTALDTAAKLRSQLMQHKRLLVPLRYWTRILFNARDDDVRSVAVSVYLYLQ